MHSRTAFALLFACLFLPACGHRDKDPGSGGAAVAAPLSSTDLHGVCENKGDPRAKPYAKGTAALHPIVAFAREGQSGEFQIKNDSALSEVQLGAASDIELVACLSRTAERKTDTCKFEDPKSLDMFEASYEITIREAATAAIVSSKTLSLPGEKCPRFKSFQQDHESSYPDAMPALVEMAKAIALGKPGLGSGPLFEAELQNVCANKAEPRAKAYVKGGPAFHSIAVFTRDSDKGDFHSHLPKQLDNLKPLKADDTELVACVSRTAERKVDPCNYDEKPPARYLDMFDASYEITLREARTAAVLATKTVSMPAGACPHSYSFEHEREPYYPDSTFPLLEVVKTFIQPASPDGSSVPSAPPRDPVDTLQDSELDKVCYGLPEAGTQPYAKSPGKVSPVLVLSRSGENEAFANEYDSDLRSWKTDKAADYQLVGCITRKGGSKLKECKFDDTKPVHILELRSASYDMALYEARTGKLLGSKTVSLPNDGICPSAWMFHGARDIDVPSPGKAFTAFAKQWAEPK